MNVCYLYNYGDENGQISNFVVLLFLVNTLSKNDIKADTINANNSHFKLIQINLFYFCLVNLMPVPRF